MVWYLERSRDEQLVRAAKSCAAKRDDDAEANLVKVAPGISTGTNKQRQKRGSCRDTEAMPKLLDLSMNERCW